MSTPLIDVSAQKIPRSNWIEGFFFVDVQASFQAVLNRLSKQHFFSIKPENTKVDKRTSDYRGRTENR